MNDRIGTGTVIRLRTVTTDQSGKWLQAGWRDFRKTPGISLFYGGIVVAAGYAIVLGLFQMGRIELILPAMAGFLLIAPILAVGLYEASRLHDRAEPVTLWATLKAFTRNHAQVMLLGVLIMLFFLAWIRVALLLFALFFHAEAPTLESLFAETLFSRDALIFLIVGSCIGFVLACIVFAIAVVSLPLLVDRRIDVITAVIVSWRVTRRNGRVLLGWAATIAVLAGIGMALFFVGLTVAMPLLGHASWHAYLGLVDCADAEAISTETVEAAPRS